VTGGERKRGGDGVFEAAEEAGRQRPRLREEEDLARS